MKPGSTAVEAASSASSSAPRFCPRRRDRDKDRPAPTAIPLPLPVAPGVGVAALSAKFNALALSAGPGPPPPPPSASATTAAPTAAAPAPPPSSSVKAAVRIFEQQQQQPQKKPLTHLKQAAGRNGVVGGECSAELLRVIASLRSSGGARSVLLLRDPGSTPAAAIAPAPCVGSISGRRRSRPRLDLVSTASKPGIPKKPAGKAAGDQKEKPATPHVPEVPHGCETVPNGGYLGRKEMFSLLTLSEGKSKAMETSDQSQSTSNGTTTVYLNRDPGSPTSTTDEPDEHSPEIAEKPPDVPLQKSGSTSVVTIQRSLSRETETVFSVASTTETGSGTLTTVVTTAVVYNTNAEPVSAVSTTATTTTTTAPPRPGSLPLPPPSTAPIKGVGSKPVRSPTYVRTVARPLPGSRLSVAGTVSPLDSPEEQDSPASVVHDVKPNASFLWRSSQPAKLLTPTDTGVERTEGDTAKQATSSKQQNGKQDEFMYDDVGRPYSPVYDDVGPATVRRGESENSSEAGGSGYEECCMEKGRMSGGQGAGHMEEDIYDDVDVCTLTAQSDFECYESICGGSSCDQSNSLYGVASTIIAEDSSGSGNSNVAPRSETSDEWVDIEQSDCDTSASTPTILLVQDRMRSRRSPSWSLQVRQTWSKSQANNRLSQEENVGSDGGSWSQKSCQKREFSS